MKDSPWFWAVFWLLLCVLPFAVLPPLIALLPLEGAIVGLWLLVWVACPALAVAAGYGTACHRVPAVVSWLFAPLGCLVLPLWGIQPEGWSILCGCVLGVIAGVVGEQSLRAATKRRRGR